MSKKELVVPVEVYSRVVGYFRPVNQWNPGKKEEYSERKEYKFNTAENMILPDGLSAERNSVCEY